MLGMNSKNPSADVKAAKALEKRTEADKALAEYRAREEAVNRNTERLRALRLARDAQNPPEPPAKARSKASKAKASSTKDKAVALSDYLKRENESGRKT